MQARLVSHLRQPQHTQAGPHFHAHATTTITPPLPGTGKTLTVNAKLSGGMPSEVVPLLLTFSARTSANMVQDIIGGWLMGDCRCMVVDDWSLAGGELA